MASDDHSDTLHFETLAIRAGQMRTPEGEQSEPIFLTSSYVFANAAQAAARFSGDEPGNIYSRFTNPTVTMFEKRLAALEGGERAVATASGMSAILSVCMGLLTAGDHVITSQSIFGSVTILFEKYLSRFGIGFSFVPPQDLDAWRGALQPNTRLFFVETPSNPLMELSDITALAELARKNACYLVVDNCFCTPALQQPLALGADIVIHSTTKYIDGQGRCLGGAVVGNQKLVGEGVYGFLRTAGPSMSPFNAWVFLKGLETLRLRMLAHSDNAMMLAQWLEQQPSVGRVYYPGLVSHPQHELAKRQQSHFGGMVAFDVQGGKAAAWRLIDRIRLMSITANLGDTKTTITHPASTTHGRLSIEARHKVGIGEGLIRISVGLEHIDDLIADLTQAFKKLQ